MKKKIRVSKEPPSSCSYLPAGEEARARFRFHCLLQDYQELLKETEEKRERLEKTLQRKLQLLAEVKFLQRKSRQFSTMTPQTDEFKSKRQKPGKSPSPSACIAQPILPVFQNVLPLKSRSHKAPTSAALFDLNQAFLQTHEETEQLVTERNCRDVDGLGGFSRGGGDAFVNNDAGLSICQGSGIGSSRAGKRKVSWQDQLALRV